MSKVTTKYQKVKDSKIPEKVQQKTHSSVLNIRLLKNPVVV